MPPKRKRKHEGATATGDLEDGLVKGTSPDGKERFVLFYGRTPAFSNFHPSVFEVNGVQFNCTEQWFHYKKAGIPLYYTVELVLYSDCYISIEHFKDEESQAAILKTDEPRKQKSLGRGVKNYDNDEWQRVCVQYMEEGNLAKVEMISDK